VSGVIISIVLADDHELLRDGLLRLLESELDLRVVGEAADGNAAVELARALAPDIVVMDVDMPGGNGIIATQQLRRECPRTRVVALSIHADPRIVMQMLRAGADGYLTKDCAFAELVGAIRQIAGGNRFIGSRVSTPVIARFLAGEDPGGDDLLAALTPREKETLQLIADGLGTRQIAERLHISIKTVETHRAHLQQKVNTSSVAELTKLALRTGLTTLGD